MARQSTGYLSFTPETVSQSWVQSEQWAVVRGPWDGEQA